MISIDGMSVDLLGSRSSCPDRCCYNGSSIVRCHSYSLAGSKVAETCAAVRWSTAIHNDSRGVQSIGPIDRQISLNVGTLRTERCTKDNKQSSLSSTPRPIPSLADRSAGLRRARSKTIQCWCSVESSHLGSMLKPSWPGQVQVQRTIFHTRGMTAS